MISCGKRFCSILTIHEIAQYKYRMNIEEVKYDVKCSIATGFIIIID